MDYPTHSSQREDYLTLYTVLFRAAVRTEHLPRLFPAHEQRRTESTTAHECKNLPALATSSLPQHPNFPSIENSFATRVAMWETPSPNFKMCTREASHLRLAILLANLVQHAITVIFYVLRSNRTATLSIIEATKANRCSSRPTCKCSAERHRRRAWQRCPAELKLMMIFNKLSALKRQQFRGSAHLAPCTNQGLAATTLGELGCQIHVGWTFLSRQQKKKPPQATNCSQSARGRPNFPRPRAGATAFFKPTRTAAARSGSETQICLHQTTNWSLQDSCQFATPTAPPASAAQPIVSRPAQCTSEAVPPSAIMPL